MWREVNVLRRDLLNGKEQVSFVRTGFNVETIIDELGLSSGIIRELSLKMKWSFEAGDCKEDLDC